MYDFGDDWQHKIEIEAILPPDPNGYYPECIAGARACPPEDCGGAPGYMHLLKTFASDILRLPDGTTFDAGKFDLKEARDSLRSFGLLMITLS